MPESPRKLQLRFCPLLLVGCLVSCFSLCKNVVAEEYAHGPDSMPSDSVPHGEVTQHQWLESEVFSGTRRRYSVYVPAQYDGSDPAALMVFQDGHAFEGTSGDFRLPVVFDNLIAKGDIPVTIAVMIDPGHKGDLPEKRGWRPRPANRSFEYDSVSGDYADLDNQFGNWPLANQQMAKALAFKDYDYKFVYGTEAHNGKHGGAIFPDSLRWLWRGWKNETP